VPSCTFLIVLQQLLQAAHVPPDIPSKHPTYLFYSIQIDHYNQQTEHLRCDDYLLKLIVRGLVYERNENKRERERGRKNFLLAKLLQFFILDFKQIKTFMEK
jgi:hypothetical protein